MSEEFPENATYSISLRIQRVTLSECFVKVPVTDAIMDELPDGTGKINIEKVSQAGIELSQASDAVWFMESETYQPHPIQKPPPELESKTSKTE